MPISRLPGLRKTRELGGRQCGGNGGNIKMCAKVHGHATHHKTHNSGGGLGLRIPGGASVQEAVVSCHSRHFRHSRHLPRGHTCATGTRRARARSSRCGRASTQSSRHLCHTDCRPRCKSRAPLMSARDAHPDNRHPPSEGDNHHPVRRGGFKSHGGALTGWTS